MNAMYKKQIHNLHRTSIFIQIARSLIINDNYIGVYLILFSRRISEGVYNEGAGKRMTNVKRSYVAIDVAVNYYLIMNTVKKDMKVR